MVKSSGSAVTTGTAADEPTDRPQEAQKRAFSLYWEPQFVQKGIVSDCYRHPYLTMVGTPPMKNRSLLFVLVSLFLTESGYPRQDLVVCGTNRERGREEIHLHRQSARFRAKLGLRTLETAPPAAGKDIGNIAVLEDSGGVVARRNTFNLALRTVTFQPSAANAARYRFETS